jgi:hypothetical protein
VRVAYDAYARRALDSLMKIGEGDRMQ